MRVMASACLVSLVGACAWRPPVAVPNLTAQWDSSTTLNDHALRVHFSLPPGAMARRPLLLYATGDGGWRGKDTETYAHLVAEGYPTAGFSAPDYLKHLRDDEDTTTPRRLGSDYGHLLGFARQQLRLPPDRPAILVGVSRGAGLSVVAAGQPNVQSELVGVLIVALTKEEEYVRQYRVPRRVPDEVPGRDQLVVQTYDYLSRLPSIPVALIQSTRDGYLPAEDARALFGPDTALRHFWAVEARDHSFAGARDVLYRDLADALAWLTALRSGAVR
jgi:hypothetical protein